jgi:cell division protein FtsB
LAHLQNKYRIGQLADEIEVYTARYQDDMRQIRELNHNPKAMERIARERYFMKHDDEDIFVLSDDERNTNSLKSDEKAE